jgi:hypothetical protein
VDGRNWTRPDAPFLGADFRYGSKPEKLNASRCFPLCPRKQTLRDADGMSVWGHEPDVGAGGRCNAAFSGIADADEMAPGSLSLMTRRTRYDDNFLGEKDDVSACLGNGG